MGRCLRRVLLARGRRGERCTLLGRSTAPCVRLRGSTHSCRPVYALPGEVEEGFTYPDGRVAVFRRDSLLGRRREARRRTGGRALASFADLKVGDLVVHAMQGIGRFEGLVAQEVLGSTRDYMQVSYRGGDTLFVPYEQMELLRQGTGGDGARLDKLGGATWAQVTDRVRKRVKALAGELLRLHAARASAPGFVFPEDGEWERELEEGFLTRRPQIRSRPSPPSRRICRGRTRWTV